LRRPYELKEGEGDGGYMRKGEGKIGHPGEEKEDLGLYRHHHIVIVCLRGVGREGRSRCRVNGRSG